MDTQFKIIKLHINSQCNLSCRDCYNRSCACRPRREELATKEIFSLLDELSPRGIKNRLLRLDLLGGEPLLRKDFFDIAAYAKKRSRIGRLQVFTNATLIDEATAREMKKTGVDVAVVTLHSHDEDVHDSLTCSQGSWEKAVFGIRALLNAGIQTYSFTVLMACNVEDIRETDAFSRSLGAGSIYFPYIQQKENDDLAIKDLKKFQEATSWIFNKSPKYKRMLIENLCSRGKACLAFVNSLTIRSDGDVTPCPFVNLKLGNIREEPFKKIIARACFNEALTDFLSVPQGCEKCSLVRYCGGGCKAFRYNLYKDWKSKDMHCRGPYTGKIPKERWGEYMPYVA